MKWIVLQLNNVVHKTNKYLFKPSATIHSAYSEWNRLSYNTNSSWLLDVIKVEVEKLEMHVKGILNNIVQCFLQIRALNNI